MGDARFTTLGGTLMLDFLNTFQMHQGQPVDLLMTACDVIGWLERMGEIHRLSPIQMERLVAAPTFSLGPLREFRLSCRTLLDEQRSFAEIASWLTAFIDPSPMTFLVDAQGSVFAVPVKGGTAGLLSLVAYDGVKLAKARSTSIKRCENPQCMAYFITQSGRRKWCAMETCGNRQKSYRHYRKLKGNIM